MNCTKCGAAIAADSKFCGACGAAVGRPAKGGMDKSTAQGWGCLALLALLGVGYCAQSDTVKDPPDARTAAVDPAPCDQALAGLEQAGLVKDRPDSNRIDVEEGLWNAMPAKQKRLAAAAVRCSALRGDIGRADFDSYAVVYGYRSGKRLAMATNGGVTLE